VVHRALAIVLPQERNFTRYATVMRGFFAISCEFFYFSRVAENVLGEKRSLHSQLCHSGVIRPNIRCFTGAPALLALTDAFVIWKYYM
jgi:hypothetical protein